MHKTAHSAENSIWWLEWSIDAQSLAKEITGADKAIELAYETNPAMGYRIAEKTILNEYETMTLDGFARERLGWWCPAVEINDRAIPLDVWRACGSDAPKPSEGKTAYGVKFSPDGASVALCGAIVPKEGQGRISLIDQKSTSHGTQWLADWLNERYNTGSCVVIDGRNGVDVLIDKIKGTWKSKISIIRPNVREVIAATSTLMDDLTEKKITWYKQQGILNDSAVNATKRPISGGWGFGGGNSAPIEACALALYGAKTCKRDPGRKMLIG